jgi:DNA-binding transcriptional ArsR family regulator
MEEKIVLDRKSFEALAVDTRVKILKSLKQRRKTLSEIANEQKMSVSGIKEHLETLENVGLIEKIDDGHKWKYYELTRKGQDIVTPRELRVWVLLSISSLLLIASLSAMFSALSEPQASSGETMMAKSEAAPEAPAVMDEGDAEIPTTANEEGDAAKTMNAVAPSSGMESVEVQGQEGPWTDLTIPMVVAGISAVTLLACLGILVRNRMRPTSL